MKSDDPKVLAVIPARWSSTRFPGKPLAELCGQPMIVHVVRRAQTARTIDGVIVATDDERIADAVRVAGADVVMTGECPSGTDRVAEALADHGDWRLAVNVQGDEPLLAPENIDALVVGMDRHPDVPIGTLCRPLDCDSVGDPNRVKVVCDNRGRALYFSRSVIPYPRAEEKAEALWRLHLGVYAYRPEGLRRFVGLQPSALESAECLEQLRALENGLQIVVIEAPQESWGVDTPEDLKWVEKLMRARRHGKD